MSSHEAQAVLRKAESALEDAAKVIADARTIAEPAGLSVESSIAEKALVENNAATTTTHNQLLGYSNTDHIVLQTGDYMTDCIDEYKRRMQCRLRSQMPESRSDGRWDKPKKLGERRRRINRESDLPEAPPVPPPAGYSIFLSQMTAKFRHDRGSSEPHNQARALTEISALWSSELTEEERDYYQSFYEEAKAEYQVQCLEFRATGHFTRSENFEKIPGSNNVWVRKAWAEKNDLERELAGYETLSFLPRPPEEDEAYQKRLELSRERRKLKLRLLAQERKQKAKVS